jgi:hypothetical protein
MSKIYMTYPLDYCRVLSNEKSFGSHPDYRRMLGITQNEFCTESKESIFLELSDTFLSRERYQYRNSSRLHSNNIGVETLYYDKDDESKRTQ